jgi:hypothetical protein
MEDVQARNWDIGSDNGIVRYSEAGPNTLSIRNPACEDLIEAYDEPVNGNDFIGNYIHDDRVADAFGACTGAHLDGMDMHGSNDLWDGNVITWCGTQCLFYGDTDSDNGIFQNNFVEENNACGSGCDAPKEFSTAGDNWIFRYNTFEGTYSSDGPMALYGNAFLGASSPVQCTGGGLTFTNNTFTNGSGTCNGAKVCTPKMQATGANWTNTDMNADFHIASSDTCAKGYGTGTPALPSTDVDGESRPQNTADAGADEIP